MTARRHQLLETLLTLYDGTGQPVTVPRLARAVDLDRDTVRDHLQALHSCELVKRPPARTGYAPTVTGREFLDLDIDEDTFAVVEPPDDA